MSFKREGNDNSLLNLLKKRRISELHSLDIPENEAFLIKNGRFACMVCHHRPIFDTVQVLNLHRNSKKHMAVQASAASQINFPSSDTDNYHQKKIRKFSTSKDYDERKNFKNETKEIKKRKNELKEMICSLIDKEGFLTDLVDHTTALLNVKPYKSKPEMRESHNTYNNTYYSTNICTTTSINVTSNSDNNYSSNTCTVSSTNSTRNNDNKMDVDVSNIKSNITHVNVEHSFPWNISSNTEEITINSKKHNKNNHNNNNHNNKNHNNNNHNNKNHNNNNHNNNNNNNNNHNNNNHNNNNNNNNNHNNNNNNNNHNNNNHYNNSHNKDNKTTTQKPLTVTQKSVYLKALQSGWVRDRSGGWVKDATVEFDSDDEDTPPQFNIF